MTMQRQDNHSDCRARWRFRNPLVLGLMLILLLAPLAAAAQDGDDITLNYEEADIQEVAQTISEVTGKNFIIDPRVKGRITITSSQAIPPDAVYETFLSILDVHGFAAMESGNTVKIVPSSDARQMPGADVNLEPGEFSDEIDTRVLRLEHVPASQLVPILRPLVPQNAHLAAVSVSNMIVIADRRSNIQRIERLIERIDRSPDEDIEVIRLEHASASEVVRVLTDLERRENREDAPPLNLVADERSNSVLLGGERSSRVRMRALISHLDTPLEAGGNTNVRYLRYADAETLSEVLREHVDQEGGDGGEGRSTERVSIVPDAGTNSLVITAPPRQMREVNSVIERLDIRRAQVLVEAIIVEVGENKSGELGVTWAALDQTGNNPVGLTRFPNSGADIGTIGGALQADQPAEALQAAGSGLLFGIGRTQAGGIDFAALFRALAGDSQTNILSTPSLLTMDNEEAEIKVGQEVPFLTGSFSGTGGGRGGDDGRGGGGRGITNPFQTIQREDVGITLKITPRINEGDAVFLDIEQEVSSIASGVSGASDLITNKRSINTRVIVEDGEVIVLGGLIDEQLREQEQRVPILGSIPVLGALFRTTSTDSEKRNLMVFLRPAILRGPDDTRHYTDAKYNRIRELQQGNNQNVPLVHGVRRPQLEPLERFRRGPGNEGDEEGPNLDMGDEEGDGNDNGEQ